MNRTTSQFEGLLARYFETLLQDNPTFSTISAGLRDGEGKLGRLTLDFQQKRERERQSALRALEGISPRELSNEQQLDRLALRSLLLKECEDYARGRHALEPNAPDQLLNILLHELHARGRRAPARGAQPALAAPASARFPGRGRGGGPQPRARLAAGDGADRGGRHGAAGGRAASFSRRWRRSRAMRR